MNALQDDPFFETYTRLRKARRILHIYGHIDDAALLAFQERAEALSQTTEGLIVMLDTPGGSVNIGLSLYQELRLLSAIQDVHLIARTRVHSIGMLLLVAIPIERRLALAPTTFLLHTTTYQPKPAPEATYDQQREVLRVAQIDNEEMGERIRRFQSLIADGTGKSREEIARMMEVADYINERSAIEHGFISRVIE